MECDKMQVLGELRKPKKSLRIVGTPAEIRIFNPGILDKSVAASVTLLS